MAHRLPRFETEFNEDLKKFDVPTLIMQLIMHGDDEQIVPIGASVMLSSKMVMKEGRKGNALERTAGTLVGSHLPGHRH
jgi:hypothetical protein